LFCGRRRRGRERLFIFGFVVRESLNNVDKLGNSQVKYKK
jgi:hypothetical protein